MEVLRYTASTAPALLNFTTRWLPPSATYRLPALSKERPWGPLSAGAEVVKLRERAPALVSLAMRLLPVSAT